MRTTLSNTCFLPHLHSQRFGHQMCLSYAGSPHTSHARWIPTHAPGPTHACTGSHACSHRVPRMLAPGPTHACNVSPRTHATCPHTCMHDQVPMHAHTHWVPACMLAPGPHTCKHWVPAHTHAPGPHARTLALGPHGIACTTPPTSACCVDALASVSSNPFF